MPHRGDELRVDGPYYTRSAEPERTSQLYEVLDLLRRGKWIIIASFLVVLALVAFVVSRIPPEYKASSLLFVSPRQPTDVQAALRASLGEAFGTGESSIANEVLILRQSLRIAERVAERLLALQTVPDTGEPLTILETEDGEPITVEEVAGRLQGRYIEITSSSDAPDLIWISAVSTVPAEAALIANLYAEEYLRRNQETSRSQIRASRAFLEEQKEKLERELTVLEDQIATYRSREGAVALDEETSQTVLHVAELESQLNTVRIEEEMKAAHLSSLEQELQQINATLAKRVASGVEKEIETAQTKIAELEERIAQIYFRNPELRNRPSNSEELQQLNTQVDLLRGRVAELSQQYVDEIMAVGGIDPSREGSGLDHIAQLRRQAAEERIALSGLAAKRNMLAQRLREQQAKLRAIPGQSLQLAQMQRAHASAEQMYLTLVEKLQEARVAEESEIGYVDVVRHALIPRQPVRPNTQRSIALGMMLGLALGIMLAVARHALDTRIYKPEDLREHGYSVIGVIPDMTRMIKKDFVGKATHKHNDREVATTLVPIFNPLSSLTEAYRRLRTNVQFSLADKVIQTVVVTSPEPEVGKSTTAINLAVTMAEAGRRTLLVDADLRKPAIHERLGLQNHPELTSLDLETEAAEIERFATYINNLYVLTAKTPVPNPTKLLSSKQMRDVISRWRELFDVIIFDTPPVMVATDAALLSTQSDVTILVVSSGKTSMQALKESAEALAGVGAVVIGTVINRFDPSMAHGYRYDYNYGVNNYRSTRSRWHA